MTLAEQERVRVFTSRDGSRWAPLRVWAHRHHAMIRDANLRGMPDDAPIEECAAWKRSMAARSRRLAKEQSHG